MVDVTERAVDSQLEDPQEDVARALVQAVARAPPGAPGPRGGRVAVPGAAESLQLLDAGLRWGGDGDRRAAQHASDRDARTRQAHERLVQAGVRAVSAGEGGGEGGSGVKDEDLLVHFDD